ncbi:Sodium/hydrogen exchanger family-domain-containing protein [Dendryphion nanum]|uniref:Sodium/hydrogen exchanger family-domain-containing protein n=1 Tax=Dendryphion nanum TaxID=256645 RepID=A0A9P9DDL5_9PLEO|nr:Sodium/hydrogen exchanger family-domain-containing protein [Dendryphion nanum]
MVTETAPSLPYHEPGIVTILIQTSFLLLLNVLNAALDRVVYCGLLGQVLIGIAWGTPGAEWLSKSAQEVIVQLGYIGLLLLVYEGGLSTSFKSLKANLPLSSAVALTGIALPIALSFSLQAIVGATPLQAFAAGAALCSTSLGTTFTVLNSSGLSASRLGVVLTSAAMMDDVVGLVMVQVISNLGGGDLGVVTVVRPILVSLAFAVVVPLICQFLVKPATLFLNRHREAHPSGVPSRILSSRHTAFTLHTLLLVGLVAAATYAGTSNLFAAYIAGASISWWDLEVSHPDNHHISDHTQAAIPEQDRPKSTTNKDTAVSGTANSKNQNVSRPESASNSTMPAPNAESTTSTALLSYNKGTSGSSIYEHYYHQAVSRILQPFFFASIGFSIPITRMFNGNIVWRGIVYTILMTSGKLVCGLWLVRIAKIPDLRFLRSLIKTKLPTMPHIWGRGARKGRQGEARNHHGGQEPVALSESSSRSAPHMQTPPAPKPFSIHPPLILALAMTARGEIGFLISAVAESKGIFASANDSSEGESDLFLIVTWAIVLCTTIGPFGVGLCARRVKNLEAKKNKQQEGAGRDVLGPWGVN